jgi:uncharacterized protein YebE (UPF0316 family)
MDSTGIITCILIVAARIVDVSLGTLRMTWVIQGRRGVAWIIGFIEILIWVLVVSQVIQNLHQPAYAISYAFGFATGNFVGMTLEKWMAFGDQVVRVFTREGTKMAAKLRAEGLRVTSFQGEGRDGPIQMLFIEAPRKGTPYITKLAQETDPKCFYIIDDIRTVSQAQMMLYQPSGWRAILKKD